MFKVYLMIALTLLLLAPPVIAGDDAGEDVSDDLELFDEDTEVTDDGWVQLYMSLGITYLDADGKFAARLPSGDKITIFDFDRAGLDETDASYWLSLNWRSADSRWGAWFGSWRYDVNGSHYWEEDFEIPGHDPIPASAYVNSEFDAQWYILEGTYSFYRSKTIDTGVGFGLHTVKLKTTLTARIEHATNELEVVSEQLDTLAPLPNILVYLHWKFADRWSLVSRLGYFGLDYKEYSGEMINAHAMLNYHLSSRWSVAVGYQLVDLDLEIEKTNYDQVYGVDFAGPMAYVRYSF